jgi:hypothetical protein
MNTLLKNIILFKMKNESHKYKIFKLILNENFWDRNINYA